MDATEATELINGLIQDADALRRDRNKSNAWKLKCETVIDRIFGADSKQLKALQSVNFDFRGVRMLGDTESVVEAFEAGVDRSKEVLRQMIWDIEHFGLPMASVADDPEPFAALERICNRFHAVARQLRHRHDNRGTLDVNDEYDVQDLLHALLCLHFDDIRREEWTPSYAGKSTRMDFLLKNEEFVIEVKKTRQRLDTRQIGEELIIDIAH